MDVLKYRIATTPSAFDYPAISGLRDNQIDYHSEPKMNGDKILLTITNKYVVSDFFNDKRYDVLSVKCDYEVPVNIIKTKEDVYAFYADALLALNEAYNFVTKQFPTLPKIVFPLPPIIDYKREIIRVLVLLNSQN